MGHCSKAVFSYGFVLDEEEVDSLLEALAVVQEEDGVERSRMVDTIEDWLYFRAPVPFQFTAVKGNHRGTDDIEDEELAIVFAGRDNGFDEPTIRVGTREGGAGFAVIPELKNFEELMNVAKEAFGMMTSTRLFKEAGITVVVPQWIMTLDVD